MFGCFVKDWIGKLCHWLGWGGDPPKSSAPPMHSSCHSVLWYQLGTFVPQRQWKKWQFERIFLPFALGWWLAWGGGHLAHQPTCHLAETKLQERRLQKGTQRIGSWSILNHCWQSVLEERKTHPSICSMKLEELIELFLKKGHTDYFHWTKTYSTHPPNSCPIQIFRRQRVHYLWEENEGGMRLRFSYGFNKNRDSEPMSIRTRRFT